MLAAKAVVQLYTIQPTARSLLNAQEPQAVSLKKSLAVPVELCSIQTRESATGHQMLSAEYIANTQS